MSEENELGTFQTSLIIQPHFYYAPNSVFSGYRYIQLQISFILTRTFGYYSLLSFPPYTSLLVGRRTRTVPSIVRLRMHMLLLTLKKKKKAC